MTEQFIIQSDIANMPLVEERLFHFCNEFHVGRYFAAISVATLQAVENAIVHGNGNQNEKKVSLTFGTCRGGVFVEVADEGVGFEYQKYGSALSDESRGEGIFVMSRLSDKMEYLEDGCRVRMEFVVDGIDPADSIERAILLRSYFGVPVVA